MDLHLQWAEGLSTKTKQEQSEALDREVDRYSMWLSNLVDPNSNGPLSNAERALLKTYLVQKLTGKLDKES